MKESRIIQGLMRVWDVPDDKLYELIKFDLENGINFFDLADCYMDGEAERKVGRILAAHKELREQMIIQTKCSIVRSDSGNYYDLSYEHIIEAVNASLDRLQIETIDILLLHRPDIFMDAKEVNLAFNQLKKENKVKRFGVSNFSREMISYLRKNIAEPLIVDQLQLGLGHLNLIKEVFNSDMDNYESHGGLFFYLKRKDIGIQAWSPFQKGFFGGSIFNDDEDELNKTLSLLAKKYMVSKCGIATAFLLNLGEDVSVITGSMSKDHVKECLEGTKITISKEDWYLLYKKAGEMLP